MSCHITARFFQKRLLSQACRGKRTAGRPQDLPPTSATPLQLRRHLASPAELGLGRRSLEGGPGSRRLRPCPSAVPTAPLIRVWMCPAAEGLAADAGAPSRARTDGVPGNAAPQGRRSRGPGCPAPPRGPRRRAHTSPARALTVSGSFSNTSRASSWLHSSSMHSLSRWPCLASSKTW